MKHILVIGNGFDLAHGLNTSYTDFIVFCISIRQVVGSHPKEDIRDYFSALKEKLDEKFKPSVSMNMKRFIFSKTMDEEIKAQFISGCVHNFWLTHVDKHRNTMGDRWCDFEYMITEVVEALSYMANHAEVIWQQEEFAYIRNGMLIKELREQINALADHQLAEAGQDVYMDQYRYILVFKNVLLAALEELTWLLEVYLEKFLNKKYTSLELFKKLPVDHIISFNYTNTYEKLYDADVVVHQIHGHSDFARPRVENNMVFGIGQDIHNTSEDDRYDYVEFQKYYQRIVKKTGAAYKSWLQDEEAIAVYIFGHSLDEPDGDVIRDLLSCTHTTLYIFYLNDHAFRSILANLIRIFSKDAIIEYTSTGKISFVQADDKIAIEHLSEDL